MKTTHLLKIVCLLCGAMLQTVSSGAQNVNMIAGGAAHSLFLKNDGSLWAMGYNYDGQLGDGTYSIFPPYYGTNQPQQIVASDVTSIAAGYGHSLFLMSDGSLRAMGWNYFGELGDGSYGLGPYYYSGTNLPEQIVASNVTAIAAGDFHSLFLKSDGSLWAMGENEIGELGNGTFVNAYIPEQIVASNVTAIAAGGSDSFFLKSDGSLWAMGWNGYGQLGDGTHYNSSTPGQIVASNVTAIAAGYGHSLFLKSDGSLWAMGLNTYGQLGDGNTDNCNCFTNDLPEQIVASNVTAIAAGYYHSLFLKSDGSLWAMGDNEDGQLGDGTSGWDNYVNIPEQIVANNVTAIAAGGNHSLFLTSDGSLWAMGDNSNGQLGDGTFNSTNLPEEIVNNDYTYMTNDDNTITITGYTGSGGAVTIPGTINGLSVTSIGDIVFAYSPDVTSVIISDGVTSIGEESFTFCENLTNVTIPASVTNIGDQAFASCTDLKEIIVDPLNLVYQSLNGVLFNYNETTLIQFPGGGPQNYNIPASVSVIGDFAFAYSDVTSVMISTNVNEILKDAFVGCGDLNSITIPGSISTISDFAIMGCILLDQHHALRGHLQLGNLRIC